MAIYHCSVKVIGRSAGRSSVAAAAYRAGEDLVNEYDGVEHDFTKKKWVEYTEIMLPENAPKEYGDRGTLWNAVEMEEKSTNAQLAREFELALPVELSREQQIKVAETFVREEFTSQGMVADIAIHNPPYTNDRHQPIDIDGNVTKDIEKMQFINPHAHILCTVRPIDEEGKWEKKSEVEYLCKRGIEEKAFTAGEYNAAQEDGWEKQYRYYEGRKKAYHTPSEAKEKDLKRVNRSPKTTPYGRKNEKVEQWNSKDRIFEWRQQWEKTVNDEFSKMQSEIRIDSRSFKDQGRDEELPTLHMGTSATNMEKRADRETNAGKQESEVTHSDIGNINRQIKEHNKFVREFKEKLEDIANKAKELVEKVSEKLENLRARIIGNKYEEAVLSRKYNYMSIKMVPEAERLEKYQTEVRKVEDANSSSTLLIKRLDEELNSCGSFQIKKRNELQNKIQKEQKEIECRTDYLKNIARMCEFYDNDAYLKAATDYGKNAEEYEDLSRRINKINDDNDHMLEEYRKAIEDVPRENIEKVSKDIKESSDETDNKIKEDLASKHDGGFDEQLFDDSKDLTDELLMTKAEVSGKSLAKEDETIQHGYHH